MFNDGSDDNRRKQTGQQSLALPLDECRHEEIDQRHTRDTCNGSCHSPLLRGRFYGCDEGKADTQEDGHDSLGNQMEDECADASRKQGGGRVETDEQRHQYRRAKGYEQKLDANNGLSRGG